LIRLHLLLPVNPKTDAEKCDRIKIGAILRLDDDENRAGLLLRPRCLVEEERADIDFRSWHIASFRCGTEFGRYRSIADIGQARTPKCKSGSDLATPSVPGYRNFPMTGVPIYVLVGAQKCHHLEQNCEPE
jgi:hypothetical protein